MEEARGCHYFFSSLPSCNTQKLNFQHLQGLIHQVNKATTNNKLHSSYVIARWERGSHREYKYRALQLMLSLILPLQSFLSSLLVYLYPPVWAKSVNRILNTHTPTNTWRVYSLVHGLYATIFLSSSWVFQLEIITCSFKFCNTFAVIVAGCEHSNLHWMDKKINGDRIWREDCSSCVPIPQRDILERWFS